MVSREFGLLIWTHVAMVGFPALIALFFINAPLASDEKQIFLDDAFEHQEAETTPSTRVA